MKKFEKYVPDLGKEIKKTLKKCTDEIQKILDFISKNFSFNNNNNSKSKISALSLEKKNLIELVNIRNTYDSLIA